MLTRSATATAMGAYGMMLWCHSGVVRSKELESQSLHGCAENCESVSESIV